MRISQFQEPKLNDNKQVTKIRADICVERDSQKGIVVGKGGHMIRDVGVEARKELQEFLQGQVRLVRLLNFTMQIWLSMGFNNFILIIITFNYCPFTSLKY